MIEGENARGETPKGLAAERTLSVTTHCLRQQQTRLLGNAGCFVSIAVLSWYYTPFPTHSNLALLCFSHTHHYTASSIHCFVLFSWLLLAFYSQPALHSVLLLLLGVRTSARHATRFASLTHLISWYRRLFLEPLLATSLAFRARLLYSLLLPFTNNT